MSTINDVAKKAGVSVTTVSYVITGKRYVSDELKERVRQAMKELDYRPNNLARSLRIGKSDTIALIIPDSSNLFFAEIARKIEDFGYQQGYSVILGNSDNNPDKQASYIDTLLAKQVDGVIFISSGGGQGELQPLIQNRIPVVVADRDISLEYADVVLLDNHDGGYKATEYLLSLGHRSIGCITGSDKFSASFQRLEGYCQALQDAGVNFDPNLVETGDFSAKGGEKAMQRLLVKNNGLNAVFVLNDMMAIGAINAAHRAGLSIPKDLSVVGFDDIELASVITPALTTVAQPFEEIARYATDLLIKRINGTRKAENERVVLTADLIIRDSTTRRMQ